LLPFKQRAIALADITMGEIKDDEDSKSNKRSHSEFAGQDGSGKELQSSIFVVRY
jgi:hypothetical protein